MPRWLVLCILVAGSIYACHDDYTQQTEAQRRYCDNVRDGVWPPYNDAIVCE